MFEQENIDAIRNFYRTYPRYAEIEQYRRLRGTFGPVKNLFYGDSLTQVWPVHEFFPNHPTLNRGIGGDSVYGLYHRMGDDVFPYSPTRVFLLIGINGIQEPAERILAHIKALADMMREKDIDVCLSSICPLREPDGYDRIQYQGKIVDVNAELKAHADAEGMIFLDYHTALKDDTGQLAAPYALDDGTHLTFDAYVAMSEVVRPHLVE